MADPSANLQLTSHVDEQAKPELTSPLSCSPFPPLTSLGTCARCGAVANVKAPTPGAKALCELCFGSVSASFSPKKRKNSLKNRIDWKNHHEYDYALVVAIQAEAKRDSSFSPADGKRLPSKVS